VRRQVPRSGWPKKKGEKRITTLPIMQVSLQGLEGRKGEGKWGGKKKKGPGFMRVNGDFRRESTKNGENDRGKHGENEEQ